MTERSSGFALAVIATAAGIAMLYFLRAIVIPLILAAVLAVLVNALVRFIEKNWRSAPQWAAALLAALVVAGLVVATFLVLAEGAANMVKMAPALGERIDQLVQQVGHALRLRKTLSLETLIGEINVPRIAGTVAGSAGGLLSTLVLMVTYFGFIVAGRKRTGRKLAILAAERGDRNSLKAALTQIESTVETYLWVQTVTGIMIGAASWLVMFSLGLENALFWTVVLFLLCYIPMIGVTVGSVVPALFALLQFPSWWQAAVIFGGIQAAATVVGNVIYPRMQAETQNIDPIATLVSLAFWGLLWGITGAFLAVPLTLIVMMICANFPRTRWVAVLLSNDGKPSFPQAPPQRVRAIEESPARVGRSRRAPARGGRKRQ